MPSRLSSARLRHTTPSPSTRNTGSTFCNKTIMAPIIDPSLSVTIIHLHNDCTSSPASATHESKNQQRVSKWDQQA